MSLIPAPVGALGLPRQRSRARALTCTISAAGTTCNDTSNTFSAVAADRISIKAVSTAGTAANLACSLELANP